MSKNFNAKQFIKRYPKELHPIAEEKMKCCNIISAEWLKKLEKSLKSPFSRIPSNFAKSIEDLVDSDGKLLQNLKQGVDYQLVTNFMFDNLSQFTEKNHTEAPREIRCGLGHDPTTGEDVVVFDLVAFNIKMVKCNRRFSDKWYASASWTFQDFLRQFCEVVNVDESTHGFYQDITLEVPIRLSLPISAHYKGSSRRITAFDLYFGPLKRSVLNRSTNMVLSSNKQHISFTNEKSMPNNSINESSPFPSKSCADKKHYSKATVASTSSSSSSVIKLASTEDFHKNKDAKTEGYNSSSSASADCKDKSKVNDRKQDIRKNSAVFQYRFSPSNDLIVPKLEPAGFVNLTNSCYMNSVLQCFIRIPAVSSLYFGDKYVPFVNTTNILSSQGNISNEFHNILNNIASSRYNKKVPYNLSDFRTAFVNQYNTFNSSEQQDAQEFLICLIDGLHEDINQAFPTQKDRKKVLETLSPNDSPWKVCQKLNKSQIYNFFLGMTETKLTCQNCSHTEIIQEPFLVLSLPLPPSGMHSAHLEDCLKRYCQKEILTKNERIECQKCQRKTNTKRVLKIQKCSEVLIIALKRFENFRKGENSSFKKNDININYPKILNMNPYSTENVGKYKLIGCVYHYGNLESGHYTAASFDQLKESWYMFDDTSVSPILEKNIYNRNAYILFYQKL